MSEISEQEFEDIAHCYQELMYSQQTLLLSTASANGVPDISYAHLCVTARAFLYLCQ